MGVEYSQPDYCSGEAYFTTALAAIVDFLGFFAQPEIALIPIHINLSALHGGNHRAARLDFVAAVAEAAVLDIGADVGEIPVDLGRLDVEQRNGADARRIGDVAPALQGKQLG